MNIWTIIGGLYVLSFASVGCWVAAIMTFDYYHKKKGVTVDSIKTLIEEQDDRIAEAESKLARRAHS